MGEKQARTSFIQLLLRRKVAHTTSSSLLVILLFTVLSSSLLTTALTYRDRGVRIISPTTIYAKGDLKDYLKKKLNFVEQDSFLP